MAKKKTTVKRTGRHKSSLLTSVAAKKTTQKPPNEKPVEAVLEKSEDQRFPIVGLGASAGLQQAQRKLDHLASFPEMNPNPVVEVNADGSIEYLNPAAKKLFPDLQDMGHRHEWLVDLESIGTLLKDQKKTSYGREVKANGNWYHQSFHLTPGADRIRIYSLDITELKQAEEKLKQAAEEWEVTFDSIKDPVSIHDKDFKIVKANKAFVDTLGLESGEVIGKKCYEVIHGTEGPWSNCPHKQTMGSKTPVTEEFWEPRLGIYLEVSSSPIFNKRNEVLGAVHIAKDITAHKRAEEALGVSNHFLQIINKQIGMTPLLKEFLVKIRNLTGCSAVGVRLLDDAGNIPYQAYEGFSQEFYQKESPLSIKSDQCMCINVIKGEIDPGLPFYTAGGSFYINATSRFLATVSEKEKGKTRNECNRIGFESVALVPIPIGDGILGLIHVADPRENMVPLEMVELLERVSMQLGTGIHRVRAEEALQKAHNELEIRVQERTAELMSVVDALQDEMAERKRVEEAVKAERQRFHDVLEMLPAYLVLLAPDYHVPFANRFFRERFGESHGQRCFEYLFGRSEPCETCESYTALKTKAPHQWEWTGPDGRNYDVFDFSFTDTDGSTLILEMGIDITERKRAQEALNAASLYTRSLIETSLDPLVTISTDGKIMDVNKATEFVTGVPRERLIGTDFSNYFTEPEKAQQGYLQVFSEGFVKDYPLAIRHTSGRVTDVLYHATVYKNEVGEIQGVFAAARDITVRKGLQRRIEATNALLNLFVRMPSRKEYLDAALELIQNWSGCRCAGIRVLDRQGHIPYESYSGFSREFWESENFLSIEKDQCACIRVVTGELDSQDLPAVTPGGSFCCANTIEFLEGLSEGEKSRYRGVCIQNGFLSVAIVPVRYREQIIGAIHVADEGKGKVALESIEFMESMAPLIGEAVNRFHLEEEIRDSETRLRHLSSELLTVQESERKRIGREIHDGIGQTLAAIKFALESKLGQMRGGAASPEASIENIISLAQNGIEESRRIQMDLRPSILDDLGILATLSWFTREFQKVYSHISIEKEIDIQENEVPDSLRIALFRVIQEALNNTAKHSKADLVRLSLGKKEDKIELNIEDNGMGFDLENYRKGLGLTSMRERTELLGGSFAIESTPGKGTTIKAQWPI